MTGAESLSLVNAPMIPDAGPLSCTGMCALTTPGALTMTAPSFSLVGSAPDLIHRGGDGLMMAASRFSPEAPTIVAYVEGLL